MKRTIRRSLLVTMISVVVVMMASMVAGAYDLTPIDPGTWNGMTYTYVIPENATNVNLRICYVGEGTQWDYVDVEGLDKTPGTHAVDLASYIQSAYGDEDVVIVYARLEYQKTGEQDVYYGVEETNSFSRLDVQVNNDVAVTEDTEVELEVDSIYEIVRVDSDTYAAEKYEPTEETPAYRQDQLIDNKLVIKKGESSVSGTVYYLKREFEYRGAVDKGSLAEFVFLKVKDGKVHSDDVCTFATASTIAQLELIMKNESLYGKADGYKISALNLKNFNNSPETFVNELATALTERGDAADAFLAKCGDFSDTMVFASKSVGVNTTDNSDLALWIALLAIATVAAGAVALKRN